MNVGAIAASVSVAFRVKELTKESAKRSNRSTSPAVTAPRSFEMAPDIVPRHVLKRPAAKPSLFHPSNIQLSSTPMKDAVFGGITGVGNPDSLLLLDGENDQPISGHHLSSSSLSSNGHQVERVSPIQDPLLQVPDGAIKSDTGLERKMEDATKPSRNGDAKSVADVATGHSDSAQNNAKMTGERFAWGKSGEGSSCSCRSLNTSAVRSSLRQRAGLNDCSFASGTGKLEGSFSRMSSSTAVSQQLFAETKARMENARTNIQQFLQSEKTRTADSSFVGNLTSQKRPPAGIDSGFGTRNRAGVRQEPESSLRQLAVKSPQTSSNTMAVGTDSGGGVNVDVVSASRQGEVSHRGVSRCDSGGRSWAEILEESSSDGRDVVTAAHPDLFCRGDDVVTPDVLDALSAKIAELKWRQEQLESSQSLFTQRQSSATHHISIRTAPGSSSAPEWATGSVDGPQSGSESLTAVPLLAASDVCDADRCHLNQKRTSAARSLLSEFIQQAPVTQNASSLSVHPLARTTDVGAKNFDSYASCLCINDSTHADMLSVNSNHKLTSGTQNEVASSHLSRRQRGGSSYTVPASIANSLTKPAGVVTTCVDDRGLLVTSVHSSVIPVASQPRKPVGDPRTSKSDSNLSLQPTTEIGNLRSGSFLSSLQAVTMVSDIIEERQRFVTAASPTGMTSSIGSIVTSKSNSGWSCSSTDSVEGCRTSQVPVTGVAAAYSLDGVIVVNSGPGLTSKHSDSAVCLGESLPATRSSVTGNVEVGDEGTGRETVDYDVPCASADTTTFPLPAADQNGKASGVDELSSNLPAFPHPEYSSDVSESAIVYEARQQLQSVYESFTYYYIYSL